MEPNNDLLAFCVELIVFAAMRAGHMGIGPRNKRELIAKEGGALQDNNWVRTD